MSTFRSQQGKTVIRMDILPPDPAAIRSARVSQRRGEVIDAQFVPVNDRKRRQTGPRCHNDNRRRTVHSDRPIRRYLQTLEGGLKNLPADLFSAVVALAFVGVFALVGGFSFLFAGVGQPVVAPVLDITHVSMTPQDANGMRVLLINGIVENLGTVRRDMPSIRADLISGDIVVASTLIKVSECVIEGRQSRGFSVKIPHPGGKLPDLRLSFAERDAPRS
jgi:hypothetical protein